MSNQPNVLTKFMSFRPEIFIQPRLKLSLPSEFNDPFDSQLRLSDDDFNILASETSCNQDQLEYFAKRMQAVHILSLSAHNATELQSSNMWGLYANSGKGIAFEFDFTTLRNLVNGQPLNSFLDGYNQLDNEKVKIEYIKCNLTEEILNQIKKYHQFLRSEIYKTDNTNDIVIIPAEQIAYPELAAFEVDFDSTIFNDIVNNNSHLLMHLLDLHYYKSMPNLSHRLYKVQYHGDYNILKSKFTELCSAKPDEIDLNLISDFMTHKTKNWEFEHEYRIIVGEYTIPIIQNIEHEIKEKNITSFNDAISMLSKKTNAKMEFIYFDKNLEVKKLKSPPSLNVPNNRDILITITTLPFPQKIYLGWDFDVDSKYGKENLALIQRYCNEHGIKELYQIDKTVDYASSQFRFGKNLLGLN